MMMAHFELCIWAFDSSRRWNLEASWLFEVSEKGGLVRVENRAKTERLSSRRRAMQKAQHIRHGIC
jgi:hypothetical protein